MKKKRNFSNDVFVIILVMIAAVLLFNVTRSFRRSSPAIDATIPETTEAEITMPEVRTIATTEETTTEADRELITVRATAYCPCEKCCGKYAYNRPKDDEGNTIIYTASGNRARANHTCGVDPSVFPFGTKIIINGVEYVAEDTGGAVKGYHIDVFCNTHEEALAFDTGYYNAEIIYTS